MKKYAVLYNPLAGNGTGRTETAALKKLLDGEVTFHDITCLTDRGAYETFLAADRERAVVISGGDGTLHSFANHTCGMDYENRILYFATGSGNDFLGDIGGQRGDFPVDVTEYLRGLPSVTVAGRTYRFLNNVGFGIDGYCCEEGDRIRADRAARGITKPINYTTVALKGMFVDFVPCGCTVTVDGEARHFERVWLAPTMNGRFYGGGMMIAPHQDRKAADGRVSVVIAHDLSKLKILTLFPSIFSGKHLKYTKHVTVLTGHEARVEFDRPCALQIDGETVPGVTSYTVSADPRRNLPLTQTKTADENYEKV